MRRAGLLLVVAILVGCGGSGDRVVSRSTPIPTASHARIERFAHIKLPPSAREVKSSSEVGIDESLTLTFVMDRRDLDPFVKSAGFAKPLDPAYDPYAYNEHGWKLDTIKHLLGGEDSTGDFGRWLIVDLDKPDIATVYMIASET